MRRVSVFNAHGKYRVRKASVVRYVRRLLKSEGKAEADISVIFIDRRYSARVNRKYLGHNYATDVLSFCLGDRGRIDGEVYVNLDQARRQARDYGVTAANEIARLVLHGTLHLLGYDDRTTHDAGKMKARENEHMRYWFPHTGVEES
jgi:probable rRNA maturation factor